MSTRILITGGAGQIGTRYARTCAGRYEVTLVDLPGRFGPEHHTLGRLVEADLTDLAALGEVFEGVDVVLHLAGQRRPVALWESLLPANVVGTYNTVVAAISARCRRVIYASSVHAVTGYPYGVTVREEDPVLPGDLYGVTKCFGEALGAYAAAREGLAFTALRIGAYQDPDVPRGASSGERMRDYCAAEDLHQLIDAILAADEDGFQIYNAVSANTVHRLPMDKARRRLGVEPQSDAFAYVPELAAGLEAVGTLEDAPLPSGMRADIDRLREREEAASG